MNISINEMEEHRVLQIQGRNYKKYQCLKHQKTIETEA